MTNRIEQCNHSVLTSGLTMGTRPSSSPEEHWETVNDFDVISDIVFVIDKVQQALGTVQEKSNGWSSHSWFNHPFMYILCVAQEFPPAGEGEIRSFRIKLLDISDTFPRSSIGFEDTDLSPASFSIHIRQKIVWMRVYILLEKLSFTREMLCDTGRQTCEMCSEPQTYCFT